MIFQPTSLKIPDQQKIEIVFSSMPSIFLSRDNFKIISTFSGVLDLEILSINIVGFTITIIVKPMFPNNLYLIKLLDSDFQVFEDISGEQLSLITDARQLYFIGVEDVNIIRDNMLAHLPSNYDTSDQTFVRDIVVTTANEINATKVSLNEINNDNFISVSVVDELYFRGNGPTDRIKNEGAYQITRIGRNITGTTAREVKVFNPVDDSNIPFEIINLRVRETVETIPDTNTLNKFDGFTITTKHAYVTRLLSVTIEPNIAQYDPKKFGYSLLNNNYDHFARQLTILDNNQILLNPLTNGIFPEPINGDTLTVIYEFDDIGKKIDKGSIELFSLAEQVNELVAASVSNFFLEFANIVLAGGQQVTLGGVVFKISAGDPTQHPSFLRELVMNTDSLPSSPGEYAVNYTTGQVFVYGIKNEIGTGKKPPVATYFYKNIAVQGIDYFINDDGYSIRLNKFSQFSSQQFIVDFLYENILSQDIDYRVSSHIEVLNERVNNRLVSDFTIQTLNGPVKDIYQILNETTGEAYTPGLIEGNRVSFAGNIPPKTNYTIGELAQIAVVDDEILYVLITTTTPNGLLKIFTMYLNKNPILNQRQDGVGSNFNTSLQFTRMDLFVDEFYFNPLESITINLGKLKLVGDYIVDYSKGRIYLGVSSIQNFDIGHVSYAYGSFIPQNKHVINVSGIMLGSSSAQAIKTYEPSIIIDSVITPQKLDYGYDVFDGKSVVDNSDSIFIAQLQDDFTVYVKDPIRKVYGVYTQNSVDGYGIIELNNKNLFNSSINSFSSSLIDLKTYVVLTVEADTNTDYYHVILNDVVSDVKSIIVIDNNIQLLDSNLIIIKYRNVIIKSVVASGGTATLYLNDSISLNYNDVGLNLDSLVDIAGHRFIIESVIGITSLPNVIGDIITVSYPMIGPQPIANTGSKILNQNGILVKDNLNIISITTLLENNYRLAYYILPEGIVSGYQVKDSAGNIFNIVEVQETSLVVNSVSIIPIIDPVAKIETQSILQQNIPSTGKTTILLPLDAPVIIGTNLKIGYIPQQLNDEILAGKNDTLSSGGVGLVIDYSIGQFFINYSHIDDEIVISYDWGDNEIDWSISTTLVTGNPYYISYNYGASRDGLESNFGSLTNIDFLQNAPLSISREIYRTAVSAAIKAFLKGPTHEAMRLVAHAFTQVDPDIEESILNQWIIGRDPLNLQAPKITGDIIFGNGKYGEGLAISKNNSIQLSGDSAIRLAQGTFSTWFRPNWNGSQADEDIIFNLPTITKNIYYNAHSGLPQNVIDMPWSLVVNSDSYGTANLINNYLEVRNAKNEYTTVSIPQSNHDGYQYDGYDGYVFKSSLNIHDNLLNFAYGNRIGKYLWSRGEMSLSVINDIDIDIIVYVSKIIYVNPSINIINVTNIVIDDGYSNYSAGLYLQQRNRYSVEIVLEDVHLKIIEPFPQLSMPIYVNVIEGSAVVTIVSGDINSLSVGQQLLISTAYPTLTNILGFTSSTTFVMRIPSQTTLLNVLIDNLDPKSHIGMQDGYGEVHLRDKLGNRKPDINNDRVNGWERQLLVKMLLTALYPEHMMVIGTNDPPLTTNIPIQDFINSIIPGIDVVVDNDGNIFEIDHESLPYVWLKKPSASGVSTPIGTVTIFRKSAGIQFSDNTLISLPINWSVPIQIIINKNNGIVQLTTSNGTVSGSYLDHSNNNTGGNSSISFGITDTNIDLITRVQSVYYKIHPIFTLNDIYIGNSGKNPSDDIIQFQYDVNTTGIPAIATDKYMAIFTSKNDANINEQKDEVFVKMKIPSSWTLSDGVISKVYSVNPFIQFDIKTVGDFIDIVDGYGLTYRKVKNNIVKISSVDTNAYVPGNFSILLDNGPELRISAGKKHYLFDMETPEGAMRLYRSGDGKMTAEIQIGDSSVLNIKNDISSWMAGELYHIAISWKINTYDGADELHLFIDGDEVPNEVAVGSELFDGKSGQVYKEQITVISKLSVPDGYIINDFRGSGLFIPDTASVQPDITWIDRTIVLDAIPPGPNIYLEEPLIVGSFMGVPNGNLVLLSKNDEQIDFSFYGPSTPVSYGLATYGVAQITNLIHANFSVYNDGYELSGPFTAVPEFRHVGITQIIELYSVDPVTGQYIEIQNILINPVTIRTYGLLIQKVKAEFFQYGSTTRTALSNEIIIGNNILDNEISIAGPAFITNLPPPIDVAQILVTKVLLPRIAI